MSNNPQPAPQLYVPTKNSTKIGMDELAKLVLGLKRDIKRVTSAIAPQSAQDMIDKHNRSSPQSLWRLNKTNPMGPATLENLTDINQDGVPDVVIYDSNDKPLYVNGYTTKDGRWANDLLYYNEFPTPAARENARNQFGIPVLDKNGQPKMDKNGQPIKRYGKRDHLNRIYNLHEVTLGEAQSPDQVGVIAINDEHVPAWYKQARNNGLYGLRPPKQRKSTYSIFQSYIFKPVFNYAVNMFEASTGEQLADKMKLFTRLASSTWNELLRNRFDPQHTLSDEALAKARRHKDNQASIQQYVNWMLNDVKANPNGGGQVQTLIYNHIAPQMGLATLPGEHNETDTFIEANESDFVDDN